MLHFASHMFLHFALRSHLASWIKPRLFVPPKLTTSLKLFFVLDEYVKRHGEIIEKRGRTKISYQMVGTRVYQQTYEYVGNVSNINLVNDLVALPSVSLYHYSELFHQYYIHIHTYNLYLYAISLKKLQACGVVCKN